MSSKKIRRIPAIQSDDADAILKKKLDKLAELQKGIQILKTRMSASKTDMLAYFEKHPQLQNSKYIVNDYAVRYINKKMTDGMSQKLIMVGLAQYFKSKGVADVGREVTQAMNVIKDQRRSKITPTIDIKSLQKKESDDDNTDEQEHDE
jgi:hypothetical protein